MAAGEMLRGVLVGTLGVREELLVTGPLSLGAAAVEEARGDAGLDEAGAAAGAAGRGLVGRGDANPAFQVCVAMLRAG